MILIENFYPNMQQLVQKLNNFKYVVIHSIINLKILQRRIPAARYTALANNQREDLIQQNLAYQQELASVKARVRSINCFCFAYQ